LTPRLAQAEEGEAVSSRINAVALASFLALACAPTVSAVENPIRIESGLIAGTVGDISIFKGIPYAAPPVGELRWKPPQPPPTWDGVREAKEFGHQCIYRGPGAFAGPGSEDCLSLNIWTPAKRPGERLPVMVWIHGGGFQFGSGRWPLFEGTALARLGVVLVTLNYRLNIFGFFSHPDLAKESPNGVSGNYGLLDQIAALKWVKNNIAKFGGDANRVTIFGESAGGSSVAYLMISPLAKGLFHRAIIESGGISSIAHLRESSYGLQPAEDSGIKHGSQIAELRAKTVQEILASAAPADGTDIFSTTLRNYWPVVDGWVIPADPAEMYAAGRFHRIPLLVGTCGNEGGFFVARRRQAEAADYEKWVRATFLNYAPLVQQRYPISAGKEIRLLAGDIYGAAQFYYSARMVARAVSSRAVKTWMFHFTRVNPHGPFAEFGAVHTSEMAYVFGNPGAGLGSAAIKIEPKDREISNVMSSAWVRFAATGDPNGPRLPKWPRYRQDSEQHLEFGDTIRTGSRLFAAELDFWAEVWEGVRKR
jgi:para-nitrobenzyl esterase